MVRDQVAARGIRDAALLDAMRKVPREFFVPPHLAEFAYLDTPLPIESGQTISQPYIVALMIEVVAPRPSDRALEIGTGSGYGAAVLAQVVAEVFTVERDPQLVELARKRFAELGYTNIKVLHGDGTLRWPEHALSRASARPAASTSSFRIDPAARLTTFGITLSGSLPPRASGPEFAGLNLTFTPSTPQLFAAVDKDKVFKLSLSTTDVYTALQALLGGYYVNQFNRFGRVWRVFVEAEPEYRTKPSDVSLFYVRNKAGTMVPLSTVMDMRNLTGPEYTTRFNEYRGVEIFALPAPGYSSGDAMNAVAQLSSEVLPRDMSYAWNGISYQESIAGSGAPVFALSLIFVFLILAALYESWSLPFSVLMSVPVAVCGAFFGLWIRRFDNDVYAQIGLIMLIGLSAKNAILIVEFAKTRFEKGEPLVASAIEGARLRLRPILMTSFAFIFGLLPLWNALGAGAMARRLIGTVTITGMIFSTGLAIFLVPALFVAVERISFRLQGKKVPAASIRQLRDASAPRPEPSPGGGN